MIEGAKEMQELIDFHRSMTFEERRAWAYSKKDEWDMYSVIQTAENKGLKRGREEGRAESETIGIKKGRAEEKLANARNCKLLGVPLEIISQATGLTIEEIERL